MLLENKGSSYAIGKQVAETKKYRLYLCKKSEDNRECLLQIAADNAQNGAMDYTAFILKQLKAKADEIEAEYAKIKTDPNVLMNYDFGFPELVDHFIFEKQDNRSINILAFKAVTDMRQMVPVSNIITKDQQRVDLRTSVWIMGKLLKILAFAHNQKITVGRLDSKNILIEPNQHYVTIFDWSDSFIDSKSNWHQEIKQATGVILDLLGADFDKQFFPDTNEELIPYTDFLLSLASGDYSEAQKAHTEFYKIVDSIWPRSFYPFTSYSR